MSEARAEESEGGSGGSGGGGSSAPETLSLSEFYASIDSSSGNNAATNMDDSVGPTAKFVPIELDKMTKGWTSEQLDIYRKGCREGRKFIVGYCDMKRFGKSTKKDRDDKVGVLSFYKGEDELAIALKDVTERKVNLMNVEGKEIECKFTDFSEIWSFDERKWFFFPPSKDTTGKFTEAEEQEEIRNVIEFHNKVHKKKWKEGEISLKTRVEDVWRSLYSARPEEKPVPKDEATKKKEFEEHQKSIKDLFEDDAVQKITQMGLDNAHLPYFVFIYMFGSSTEKRYDGILCIHGPFNELDSRVFMEAVSKNFPTAFVRSTQLFNFGGLHDKDDEPAETIVISDTFIRGLLVPSKESQLVAENFDSLMTDRQKLYHQMCKEKGVTPKIVENAGGKVTSYLGPDGVTIIEGEPPSEPSGEPEKEGIVDEIPHNLLCAGCKKCMGDVTTSE